jgi:hypothetical protein
MIHSVSITPCNDDADYRIDGKYFNVLTFFTKKSSFTIKISDAKGKVEEFYEFLTDMCEGKECEFDDGEGGCFHYSPLGDTGLLNGKLVSTDVIETLSTYEW